MTFKDEIVDMQARLAKAQSERDAWQSSGMQEKYLEAYSRFEALELGLERLRQEGLRTSARDRERVGALLASPPGDSPFGEPAARANDSAFTRQVHGLVADSINPAIRRYRDYLAGEYRGRAAPGVSANPDGAACYAASVRFHTSLDIPAREIHETGLREMAAIQGEMAGIARDSFGTGDVKALLEQLRTDPKYTFRTGDEVLDGGARRRDVRDEQRVERAGLPGHVLVRERHDAVLARGALVERGARHGLEQPRHDHPDVRLAHERAREEDEQPLEWIQLGRVEMGQHPGPGVLRHAVRPQGLGDLGRARLASESPRDDGEHPELAAPREM